MIPGVHQLLRRGRPAGPEPHRGRYAPLHILPGGGDGPGESLDLPGGKVLMKAGKRYPQLLEELDRRGLLAQAGMVENCGLPGERVFPSWRRSPSPPGIFATIILP